MTGGGGGYGNPKFRKTISIKNDLKNEIITSKEANKIYKKNLKNI